MEVKTMDVVLPDGVPEGYIVLRRMKGSNSFEGLIENSWNLDWSKDRVRFWWSGTGTDNIFGLKHTVDGKKDAEHYVNQYKQKYDEVVSFNVRDPDLPVILDWDYWLANREGKFEDRNPKMRMK